ncbi:extracellular solute-binding protein [Paenibacillus sp. F411]|uniref:extracellular solute-binding protein n=1 Tax=Paenibacillus sp. F411 TaxID=2820239 RepID=UPI001AAEAAC6|nr:extracellular solute-binding protein [Paenibacillus sp. F411]MBO2942652.1 extracellular solute-binding protein [Paenibacillus sp. F411]
MLKLKKGAFAALSIALIMAQVLTGCASSNSEGSANPGGSDSPSTEASSPTEISMQTLIWGTPPDVASSPFYKELQERTNVELSIDFVTSPSFTEKINLALASRKLADITVVKNFTDANIVNAINQGAFLDLTPYLSDMSKYPNLAMIPENIWADSKINGKIYGIPNATGLISESLLIRKDWLEELNLKTPETMDELTEVMKAFKANKPDIAAPMATYGTYPMAIGMYAHGTLNPEVEGQGLQLIKQLTPYFRDYLEYARNLYQEKLIPAEYSVLKAGQEVEMFQQGKAGVLQRPIHNAWKIEKELKKTDPQGEVMVLPPLKGTADYAQFARDSFFGAFMIPASVDKDKVEKILEYLEQSASKEINELRQFGIEGIHHKVENGEKVVTDADALAKDVGGSVYVIVNAYNKYFEIDQQSDIPSEFKDDLKKKTDMYYEQSKLDPGVGLISDTYAKRSADVFKDLETNITKVIVGQSTIEDWDAYVDQLLNNSTVQTMMQEFEEQYKIKQSAQ